MSGDAARLAVLIDAENVPVSIWPVIQRLLPRLGGSWFARAIVAVTSNPLVAAHPSHSSALSVPLGRAEAKEARFVDAFRRCTPDNGGWVHLSKFGAALKSSGVSFKGKLFEVSSSMSVFEVRGPKGLDAAIRLRGGPVSVGEIDESASVTETVKALL